MLRLWQVHALKKLLCGRENCSILRLPTKEEKSKENENENENDEEKGKSLMDNNV